MCVCVCILVHNITITIYLLGRAALYLFADVCIVQSHVRTVHRTIYTIRHFLRRSPIHTTYLIHLNILKNREKHIHTMPCGGGTASALWTLNDYTIMLFLRIFRFVLLCVADARVHICYGNSRSIFVYVCMFGGTYIIISLLPTLVMHWNRKKNGAAIVRRQTFAPFRRKPFSSIRNAMIHLYEGREKRNKYIFELFIYHSFVEQMEETGGHAHYSSVAAEHDIEFWDMARQRIYTQCPIPIMSKYALRSLGSIFFSFFVCVHCPGC